VVAGSGSSAAAASSVRVVRTSPRCSRTLRSVIAVGPVLVSVPVTVTTAPGVTVRGSKRPTSICTGRSGSTVSSSAVSPGAFPGGGVATTGGVTGPPAWAGVAVTPDSGTPSAATIKGPTAARSSAVRLTGPPRWRSTAA
jgi:hypothetical protein